jgi:hypothetical protein
MSCSSSPKSASRAPSGTIRIVEKSELVKRYGNTTRTNPYLPPSLPFLAPSIEYVVLAIETDYPGAVDLKIGADLYTGDGNLLLSPESKDDFAAFWATKNEDAVLMSNRQALIDRYYLPRTEFRSQPGQHLYYLVIEGKYPIQRPAYVHGWIQVNGQDLFSEDIPLPEIVSEKKQK